MKHMKYSHTERVEWTKVNRPVVYESIKDDLGYPDRVKEILNFNDIPHGYAPDPITTDVLTYRIRVALEFLGNDAPGFHHHREQLSTKNVVWVRIDNLSILKQRYSFQLEDGTVLTTTVKGSNVNRFALLYWRKYVMKEGGIEAGSKI